MCLTLYLATPDEQPLQNSPELSVEAVAPAAEAVRKWFSLPVIRFVGAYTGCSCGFRSVVGEGEPLDLGAELLNPANEDQLGSARCLIALIQRHVAAAGHVEMYPVWNGEEDLPPKGTIELVTEVLDPHTFFFNERFFYRVSSGEAR